MEQQEMQEKSTKDALKAHSCDEKAGLTFQQQIREILPLSICFALSVAMGNLLLGNCSTGCSMSPLITVLLAVAFQKKRFSVKTWLSLPVICIGLAICSVKAWELNFNALGAFYATGATVLRSVKSLIQGRLGDQGTKESVYYMSPMSALWLFILMLFMEDGYESCIVLLSCPSMAKGLNACLLNIANFLVTSYTSPVTLQVLGNVKSCLSIGVSVAIFRTNSLTSEQAAGVSTCLLGVWLYNRKEPQAWHEDDQLLVSILSFGDLFNLFTLCVFGKTRLLVFMSGFFHFIFLKRFGPEHNTWINRRQPTEFKCDRRTARHTEFIVSSPVLTVSSPLRVSS
eukprot:Skav233695  [mRNA]  locus=scaffold1927:304383:322906:+ [translate_table: standard]